LDKIKILLASLAACVSLILLAVLLERTGVFFYASRLVVPAGEAETGSLPFTEGLDDVKNIPKGEIRYRLNKSVTFQNTYWKGDIMVENPAACEYDLQFVFYKADTGDVVYESRKLKPGEFISGDRLKRKLKEGTHNCVYKVNAYTVQGESLGDTSGYLTITVKK